jgi:hypothetical protein
MHCHALSSIPHAMRVLAASVCAATMLACAAVRADASQAPRDPSRVTFGTESIESAPRDELRVAPTRIVINEARPGTSTTQYVHVRNRRSRTTTFTLEVVALAGSPDPLRRVTFLDPNDSATQATAKPWVRPMASQLELKPRQYAVVPVRVQIPASAQAGGHYAAVVIRMEQAAIPNGPQGGRLGVSAEAAVPLLITVPGAVRTRARIVSMHAARFVRSRQSWPVQVLVENTGRVHVAPRGNLRVTSLLGNEVARIQVQPRTLLPGARDRTTVTWKRTPWIGRYRVETRLSWNGASGPVSKTLTLWVMPPWWTWLLGACVLAAIVFGVARRRRAAWVPEEASDSLHKAGDEWPEYDSEGNLDG